MNQTPVDHHGNTTSGIITGKIKISPPPRLDIDLYVRSLSEIVQDRSDQGWSVDLVTIMPEKISLDIRLIPTLAHDPVTRTYARLISRVVRRPRSATVTPKTQRPILIGGVDIPVYKGRSVEVSGNDGGLHFHGLLALPPRSRLKGQTAVEHFTENDGLYRRGGGIARIDVRPIQHGDILKVARYCLKAVCRGQIGIDAGVVILPRALSELSR
ncbi:hypothetical protein [Methylobacterium durans]|uniref:Uncharacterized protein n=1 Tax=Methylobacterium durans TaxID=2202825 RepID=A0A2U8W2G0_9HYPH|nr:hypothetical protein [Methylobacterium durans]AWN39848.1 hypothetical protein DK389_03990 [Methylobacterium durans]